MLKFIKIGDDESGETLNAKDALLLWVQNKASYIISSCTYAGKNFKF